MSTLVLSDLHIGGRAGVDLLRRPAFQESLFAALEGAEEVVLLGDVIELREGPMGRAMAAARPFFEALGGTLGSRPVTLLPGNHDHRLLAGWIERRRREGEPAPLGVEQRIAPAEASDAAGALKQWLGDAPLELAYPGVWLREDVYATHGHYLDRHVTVPSFEVLGIRVVERILRRGGAQAGVEGYEAALGPVYALLHEFAQSAGAGNSGASQRAYTLLTNSGGGAEGLRARLARTVGFPGLIAAINAGGLGPVRADLSGPELRRSALKAFGETLVALGIEARHVVFGHTHRAGPLPPQAGPLPDDHPAEWRAPNAATLTNCGSWCYEPFYLMPRPGDSPYCPGNVVVVDAEGPPELRRLLADRSHAELTA